MSSAFAFPSMGCALTNATRLPSALVSSLDCREFGFTLTSMILEMFKKLHPEFFETLLPHAQVAQRPIQTD